MADILSEMATKVGISPDMVRRGMGIVLEFCKNKLPPEVYSKITAALPDADGMVAAAEQTGQESSGGGVVGAVTGLIGKMFGGGGADIAGRLSQVGFSADQIQTFLPLVLAFLKDKVPPDTLETLSGWIPAMSETR